MLVAAIIIYILATILIGVFATRFVKNSKDYVLAGRKLPVFLCAPALFATWFGSETVLGASSEFVEKGMLGVIEDPFGAALCLLLLGLVFARPFYRMNLLSICDFYREKFGAKVELVSSIFMVLSYIGWVAAQLVAFGIIINVVTGLEFHLGVILGMVVVLIYTYVGGMWAISITDFIQTIVIVIGLVVLAISMIDQAGGIAEVLHRAPPGFFNVLPKMSFSGITEYISAWIIIGLGSIPQQDLYQRAMSSKSEDVAVKSAYLGSLLYLSVAFLPLIIALCARFVYPELLENDGQLVLPTVVLNHSNVFIQIMFFGALLSAIMSTASGAILAPATILGENIIKPHLPKLSEKKFLFVLRLSVVIITLIGLVFALIKGNIYELVGESSILSLVSLFVPLVAGMWWKRANTFGAMLSMFSGFIAWIIFENFDLGLPAPLAGLIISALGMYLGTVFAGNFSIAKPKTKQIAMKNS